MEKIKLDDGKQITVTIDYGNGLPYKPLIIPKQSYGSWNENTLVAFIRIDFDKIEFDSLIDKKIKFKELHFIDNQFWFDLNEFYLIIHSSDYLYNKIIEGNFLLVFFDNNDNQFSSLNFYTRK